MKKIKTLLPKDPNDLGKVIPGQIQIQITHFSIKIDGTSCLIKDGKPYCRLDLKLFKRKHDKIVKTFTKEELMSKLPEGAIACQEPDNKSGHWPHWIPVSPNNPEHKYIYEGFTSLSNKIDGTYECIGPKIQGNPHNESSHIWVQHASPDLIYVVKNWQDNPFETFKNLFKTFSWEGLVAYNGIEPVAKIRRTDFGYINSNFNSIKSLQQNNINNEKTYDL